MANKPVLHRRDHEHGGADPVRIVWESTGTAATGAASFAGGHGVYSAFGSGTSSLTMSNFSSTDATVFDIDSGFVRILGPGFYQVAAHAQVQFVTIPSAAQRAQLWPLLQDAASHNVGESIETYNDKTANNDRILPPGVNEFPTLQRIIPVSFTTAADFPISLKPQIILSDISNLRVSEAEVWGFRIGGPHTSYFSD